MVSALGPGIAVVVCHVAVGVEVLGIPVVVQENDIFRRSLAANPRDYAGACRSSGGTSGSDGATAARTVGASAAAAAGLLATVGNGALVVVCASGDGQLFLTPTAAAALAAADVHVTFGSCGARAQGGAAGGRTAGVSDGSTLRATHSGVLVNGRVSIPASSLAWRDRLLVTRVSTTPTVIRASGTRVTARFVIVNDKDLLVQNATVRIRSTPLGYVQASAERRQAADGSVRFQLDDHEEGAAPGGRATPPLRTSDAPRQAPDRLRNWPPTHRGPRRRSSFLTPPQGRPWLIPRLRARPTPRRGDARTAGAPRVRRKQQEVPPMTALELSRASARTDGALPGPPRRGVPDPAP